MLLQRATRRAENVLGFARVSRWSVLTLLVMMMEQEHWAEIDRIFQQAMDLPEADRRPFVEAAACEGSVVRQQVLELLGSACMDLVGPVVDAAAISFSSTSECRRLSQEEDDDDAEGQHVGPYRLLDSLGRGGMGQVFRAIRDDDEFRKEVALKMLRPEVTHYGAEVTRRFLAERQILATLEHRD